ncbi:MAG: acylphosphatase [Myxococcales bacterium]|nr:acylphosphatase [Myxococcales bacterium]
MERKRVNLRIEGLVQGVWFRQSAKHEAERLGLVGWVRNLAGGEVEAVAEGPEMELEQFVAWCHKGPPAAQVAEVRLEWGPPSGSFTRFSVER